jgi:hypothetical protein
MAPGAPRPAPPHLFPFFYWQSVDPKAVFTTGNGSVSCVRPAVICGRINGFYRCCTVSAVALERERPQGLSSAAYGAQRQGSAGSSRVAAGQRGRRRCE